MQARVSSSGGVLGLSSSSSVWKEWVKPFPSIFEIVHDSFDLKQRMTEISYMRIANAAIACLNVEMGLVRLLDFGRNLIEGDDRTGDSTCSQLFEPRLMLKKHVPDRQR